MNKTELQFKQLNFLHDLTKDFLIEEYSKLDKYKATNVSKDTWEYKRAEYCIEQGEEVLNALEWEMYSL